MSARELLVNGGNGGSGVEAPDRGSANTLCHPLSPVSSLYNLLFPSNLPQPHSAVLYVLARPGSSFSFLDLRQRPDWSSTPDCGSSEMTNCCAKQSGMQNFENTWIKLSVYRDYMTSLHTCLLLLPKNRKFALFILKYILMLFIKIRHLICVFYCLRQNFISNR